MAKVAGLRGGYMGSGFSRSTDPVMAGFTGTANHISMVEEDQLPALSDMTGIAWIVGGNMAGMLTRCNIAVMAAFTGTGHLGMVDMTDSRPTEGRVAKFTGIARQDVITTLALS